LSSVSGTVWVELATGVATSSTGLGTNADTRIGNTGYSTATTSVSISTTGHFNAGSVTVYGVK